MDSQEQTFKFNPSTCWCNMQLISWPSSSHHLTLESRKRSTFTVLNYRAKPALCANLWRAQRRSLPRTWGSWRSWSPSQNDVPEQRHLATATRPSFHGEFLGKPRTSWRANPCLQAAMRVAVIGPIHPGTIGSSPGIENSIGFTPISFRGHWVRGEFPQETNKSWPQVQHATCPI